MGGVLTVRCEDGSSFFISTDLWDHENPPQSIEELEDLASVTSCRKKALDLLARRDHSRGELRLKLMKRDFTSLTADRALDWIAYKGYLDDESFAVKWVKERLRKHPEGPMALEAGMRKKGISTEVIRQVLGNLSYEERRDALIRAQEKVSRRYDDPQKIRQALMRRGFGRGDFRLLDD